MSGERKAEARKVRGGLKARLIDAAGGILEESGIEGLSLRATARAAGVSHMAPYRHFADKDALLATVAEAGFRELAAAMDRTAARERVPKARLRAIGRAYLRFARRRPALYRLMFGPMIPDKTCFPGLAEAGRTAFARCTDAVAACLPAGKGDTALDSLTVTTWALVHGLASLLIDGRIVLPRRTRKSEDRLIEQVLDVHGAAFDGAGVPGPPGRRGI